MGLSIRLNACIRYGGVGLRVEGIVIRVPTICSPVCMGAAEQCSLNLHKILVLAHFATQNFTAAGTPT